VSVLSVFLGWFSGNVKEKKIRCRWHNLHPVVVCLVQIRLRRLGGEHRFGRRPKTFKNHVTILYTGCTCWEYYWYSSWGQRKISVEGIESNGLFIFQPRVAQLLGFVGFFFFFFQYVGSVSRENFGDHCTKHQINMDDYVRPSLHQIKRWDLIEGFIVPTSPSPDRPLPVHSGDLHYLYRASFFEEYVLSWFFVCFFFAHKTKELQNSWFFVSVFIKLLTFFVNFFFACFCVFFSTRSCTTPPFFVSVFFCFFVFFCLCAFFLRDLRVSYRVRPDFHSLWTVGVRNLYHCTGVLGLRPVSFV